MPGDSTLGTKTPTGKGARGLDRGTKRGPDPVYTSGPMRRATRTDTAPSAPSNAADPVRSDTGGRRSGGVRSTPASGTGDPVRTPGGRGTDRVAVDGLRKLEQVRPGAARGVRATGATIGRANDVAIGASIAAVGGIYSTPYLGATNYYRGNHWAYPRSYYCPWGFSYYGGSTTWSLNFGWGYSRCSPWYWPTYLSCWYPIWYTGYRPYSAYYYPTTYETVVYRTVYVDEYETAASVATPAPAPPAAPEKTTIQRASERYVQLGDQAFREERYTDAAQLYGKAIDLAPEEGALYIILSDALFAAGDYHYGAFAVRRGLELDRSLASAAVDKHEFYPEPRRFDEQLAVLESYVLEHPYDRDARLMLALNNLFGGRPAAAVDVLETDAAATLRGDLAAELVLEAARARQYGATK